MPLDILYEVSSVIYRDASQHLSPAFDTVPQIFGHLHPHDLLRLSRATKALRDILLRRSAKSVWKEALAQVEGLPACPSDVTEPQWASLAFAPYCHVCTLVFLLFPS